jgi:hypothetical protein
MNRATQALMRREELMSQLIARVVSSPARSLTGARLTVSLRRARAAAVSLLADRALGA